ncbi:MAG: Co2+/Mg2+ efflux protein ApaG [Bdellovibrio sp.]|nr:MAG: Co2+/Mg2+ efflux protein ApaG [Bdellovibrio sp.]
MPVQKRMNPKFSISVSVAYNDQESRPVENYHFFSYRIRITNSGSFPAQLMSRHWIITDAEGRVEEVRGAGVVGVQPRILPGKSYEYESFCPLNSSSGSMRGFYQMVDDQGESFQIEIPEFYLIAPEALH